MRHLKPALVAMFLAVLIACPPKKIEPVEPRDTDMCGLADQKLEKLQCTDRAGDPMWVNKLGERFKSVCETAQKNGGVFLNPRCISAAKSCEEAKACPAE